ncbi:hypothetical protein HPB50_016202 [Hyalomma asiaticum]|uniref:Uncharacterized protein n=1 Tax=Hyalomma asiaticum TaxID=266040 RepID=A0ACB7SQM6_HYAAI|nr:hypothetical protein HPB50_016202 [Hyalomma asiaticum]
MACGDVKQLADQLFSTSITDSKEVSFKDKALKLNTEKDASIVVEAITRCPKLEMLCLEGNTLGVGAAKAIGKALESCPNLKRALWKDLFTGRLRTEIPDAVRFLSSGMLLAQAKLTELDLSDNAFGPIGAGALLPLLSSSVCFQLEILRLNNNGLGTGGAEYVAKALTICLEESTKAGKPLALRTFICGRNRLENVGAIAMGAVFGEVNLGNNEVALDGGLEVVEALKEKPDLETLELDGNKFGPEGVNMLEAIMEAVGKIEALCAFSDDEGVDEEEEEDEDEEEAHEQAGDSAVKGKFEKEYIEASCSAEVASVVGSGDEGDAGKQLATDCADALLSAAFNLAKEENHLPWLTNEIVVNLGLLKAEKDHKVNWPAATTQGAMVLLAELVPKEYFVSTTREALQAFLSKFVHFYSCLETHHSTPV